MMVENAPRWCRRGESHCVFLPLVFSLKTGLSMICTCSRRLRAFHAVIDGEGGVDNREGVTQGVDIHEMTLRLGGRESSSRCRCTGIIFPARYFQSGLCSQH